MQSASKGHVNFNGVHLEKHEKDTINIFVRSGHFIEVIPPSNSPHIKTPDFTMDGISWEMKSPQGKSKNTLEHIFKRAKKQSENIIIDLTHSKISEEVAIKEIERRFIQTSSCRRLKIITCTKKVLDYKK